MFSQVSSSEVICQRYGKALTVLLYGVVIALHTCLSMHHICELPA